ncbi:ATP-binding protein [Streptomyces spectabilis]|uniref:ATP-binding protein n=1 Tax=Streptomyces spectabilis TaxID=68270 RepID=UPI0033F127EB
MRACRRSPRRAARAEYHLPCQDDSAGLARTLTRTFLARAREDAPRPAEVDDAMLVVSELVANATRHGRSCCRLRLTLGRGDQLTVEVHDDNPRYPRLRAVSVSAEHGRGIALVRALSRRLSVSADAHGGKTVRAVLPAAA